MHDYFFLTAVQVFPLQLFTTRALNKGAPDTGIWRLLWAIEWACLALVLAGFVTVQFWLVQIAMKACLVVFLLRGVVRCCGLGLAGFAKMVGTGLAVFGQVAGAFLMAFLEAVPEALSEAVESEPESTGYHIGPSGLGAYNYSTGRYDYEFGLRIAQSTDRNLIANRMIEVVMTVAME
ncbi:MAG: hypothetical protein ACRERU_12610 [Methylococcales bacterium]